MKDALVAKKRFLFGGVILAIGALFYAQKSIGRELIANGLARLATAEELQANGALDEAMGETDAAETEQEQGDTPTVEPEQPPGKTDAAETEQEADHADASGDAPASEEPPAPVPARRGRKSAS